MSLWRKSAGYAVGRGIASAMVFLLLPLLTRLMNAEEFGIWQALAFWAGAITVIVQFGTDQSLFKFFILDRTQRGKYLFSSLLTIFSLSIVFLVLCWFFRTGLAGIILGDESRGSLIFLTALWGISDALFFILASLFQAQEQVKMFVIADIMRAALGYGIAILLLMKGFGVSGVLIGWTAAGFAAFVLFLPEIVRQCTFSTDGGIFSPMLKYGFPLAVNMLIVKIFSFSDRWLLARLDSFSSAGEYSAAVKIAGIVAMAVVPIRYAWVARMFNMHRENTLKRQLPTIWRQMSGAMAVITIATIILSPEIFKIMIGPGYEAGLVVVPILAAVYFLDALMLIADAGIYVFRKNCLRSNFHCHCFRCEHCTQHNFNSAIWDIGSGIVGAGVIHHTSVLRLANGTIPYACGNTLCKSFRNDFWSYSRNCGFRVGGKFFSENHRSCSSIDCRNFHLRPRRRHPTIPFSSK